MTHYFLDSSAVIKRYLVETGTHWIRQVVASTSGNTIFVAQITPVEVVSGFTRQVREGNVLPPDLGKLRLLLDHHMRLEYAIIAFDATIAIRAADLLVRHPLRAYDAIQLASALDRIALPKTSENDAPIFVTADRRLLAAADSERLTTEDPNQHA